MRPWITALTLASVLAAAPALAQTQPHPKPKDLQPLPDMEAPPPPKVEEDPSLEHSQVTTVTRGTDRVEEYRMHGKLYRMRVFPASGAPYWLEDPKGDGNFVRVDGPGSNVAVPKWVIKEW